MAIILYSGKTGAGKTLDAVKDQIVPFLKTGGRVFSNIRILCPEYEDQIYYYRHLAELINVSNCIVFMDEAQVLLDARLWESLPPEFSYKLQQHRKHRVDLVATTQEVGQIDIRLRSLIHQIYFIEPILTLKSLNPFVRDDKKATIFHWYRRRTINMDSFRARQVNEAMLETDKSNWGFVSKWSKKLYDTYEDIGFQPYKVLCSIQKISYKVGSQILEKLTPVVDIVPSTTDIPTIKPQQTKQQKPVNATEKRKK